jgi:hypothetical protein
MRMHREKLARLIASEIENQDYQGSTTPETVRFDRDLCWNYIDQGEVDFGKIADAVIAAIYGGAEKTEPSLSDWKEGDPAALGDWTHSDTEPQPAFGPGSRPVLVVSNEPTPEPSSD